MLLADGLRIEPGRVVAFVGAGGKTSAIRLLVRELQPRIPVLVSTTTRLGLEQSDLAAQHVIVPRNGQPSGLREMLERQRSVQLTGPAADEEPKWTGIDPDALERMHNLTRDLGTVLLVEADGARGRSLKAPAAHEPAIPAGSDLVVCVAGLDVLRMPLSAGLIHRPERVSGILGRPLEGPVAPEHVASVLLAGEGGRKGVPRGAEFRVLLNKADDETRSNDGREIASLLLQSHAVNGVAIASLHREPPVQEVWGRVAGIVLAAGSSSRLGVPKQLVQWRGKPLVWYPVSAARAAGLSPLLVVLGCEADAVREALIEKEVRFVENPDWAAGQSSSVRTGLLGLMEHVEAAVFLLADMPLIDADLIQALVREHRRTLGPIVAPHAAGEWGSPVLFDRATFAVLQDLKGDRGGKSLFDRFDVVAVPWDSGSQLDVDDETDIRRLRDRE